jgi:hypothetical protein
MAVTHYTYLVLKMPGPNGVITVKGSFKLSDICDKEFHKMAQTFGMVNAKGKQTRIPQWLQGNSKETKKAASSQNQRNFESKRRTRANLQRTSQGLPPSRRKIPSQGK